MKNIFRIIIISLITLAQNAHAYFIYDAQTFDVINEISAPIFKAANLKNAKIYVINDFTPNAYTDGMQNIFIHSGLIYKFPNPDVLRGVIAHEVGHIKSGHVSKRYMQIINQQKMATTSMILGIVAAAATGSPEMMLHSTIAGSHMAERNILKFSRQNETEADLKALQYLKDSGYSASGLEDLLTYLNSTSRMDHINKYELTHPVSSERISLIRKNSSKSKTKSNSNNLNEKYNLVAAKLMAFTSNNINLTGFTKDAINLANAIKSFRQSKLVEAQQYVDLLISKYPENPYFYELKGEIFLNFGKTEAIDYFNKALEFSSNKLIRMEKEIAVITLSNNAQAIKKAIAFFEMNLNEFERNKTIIKYLILGHGKIEQHAHSMYYRAVDKLYDGQFSRAKDIASRAVPLAKNNKALLVKLNDIISLSTD